MSPEILWTLTKRVTRLPMISKGKEHNKTNFKPISKQTPMKRLIYRAMHQSDHLVIEFDYSDSKGVLTHRVVSPIRFLGKDRFLALCLSREEPRQFYLDRCTNVTLAAAADFLMPVPMMPVPMMPVPMMPVPMMPVPMMPVPMMPVPMMPSSPNAVLAPLAS
jgi:hypothetical protein